MNNIPKVKLGLVAVSRDCFPISLSISRKKEILASCKTKNVAVIDIPTTIENENDTMKALQELKDSGANALAVYLGNFGPEGPETMLAQKFGAPAMFVGAAEEKAAGLKTSRGDAYCGMLNASYNLGLRGITPYIPEFPVGTPSEIADMIGDFVNIARVIIGIKNLKILSYGPRPQDFVACNAPIKPLYDIGVELMENSELDLFVAFNEHADDPRIPALVKEMETELADGNCHPGVLPRLAQYELTLLDLYNSNKGASAFAIFANKCWPAFQTQFKFVPCYVNGRLAERGIPVSCETDIYGALSEYIIACASESSPGLLDLNNSVPYDMYEANSAEFAGYSPQDLFMGFHCGNISKSCVKNPKMNYQVIMHSLLEPDKDPDITRGTYEGALKDGEATIFRLQGTADCKLRSYIAEGEISPVDPGSFGSIGIFKIKEMVRFYRHVLIAKGYPHHAGVAFRHTGKVLFAAMKMLGIEDVAFNQPAGMLYKDENPFL